MFLETLFPTDLKAAATVLHEINIATANLNK